MQLEIVTPEGHKLTEEVSEITAPGVLGELGILPGHIPILTVLDIGRFAFVPAGGPTRTMAISGGFLEVDGDRVIVITETAEYAEDIDTQRAQAALQDATQKLDELEEDDSAIERQLRRKRRAEARLNVAAH